MKNLNTPKFWDEQFSKQWKIVNQDITPTEMEYFRWDAVRFDVMTRGVGHKGSLLDVGCGIGDFTRYVKAKYPLLDITGIDFSEFAIDKAIKTDGRMKYLVGDIYNMDILQDKQFDYVVCTEVFEHLSYPEKMLKEVNRILKVGGIFVMSTPTPKSDGRLSSEEHVKEYYPQEVENLMEQYFDGIRFLKPPVFYDVYTKSLIELWWYATVGKKKGELNGK